VQQSSALVKGRADVEGKQCTQDVQRPYGIQCKGGRRQSLGRGLAPSGQRKDTFVTKLARAVDEVTPLAPDKVKTILGKDWKDEFLFLESPDKNNWRRSSYG
jgi:hypothetical protein